MIATPRLALVTMLAIAPGCSWVFMDKPTAAVPPSCTTSRVMPALDAVFATAGLALVGATIASPTPPHGQFGNPDPIFIMSGFALAVVHGTSFAAGLQWSRRCRDATRDAT